MWLARRDFDVEVPRDVAPREGDTVRLYGPGPGSEIHGVDLNGRRLYYLTQAERRACRQRRLADLKRQQEEEFDRNRGRLDAMVAALSPPLRARIERFRSENSNFRVKSEGYELAVCVDADQIAAFLRSEHGWEDDQIVSEEQAKLAVQAFKDLSWSEQKARIPKLDDGHGGNTFGDACGLAFALLTGQRV